MGLSDYKINSFSKPVSALDDTPQLSAAELKAWFDSNSANELKNSVNGIIEELKDVDVSKQHTHDNKDVLDALNDDIIEKQHTHNNKDVLDALNDNVTKFDVSKQHSHDNKDILDNITETLDTYATKQEVTEEVELYHSILDGEIRYTQNTFNNALNDERIHADNTYATKEEVKNYVDEAVLEDVKGYIDETILEDAKSYVNEAILEDVKGYAVKSERDLIDSSSIRLYGVKNNQDVFEAPRSNTSSSEAGEAANISQTAHDRFLDEDVFIYKNTIMRRDDNGRCSVLAPAYPKHIANKEYVDNAISNAVSDIETGLDNIITIQNTLIGGGA